MSHDKYKPVPFDQALAKVDIPADALPRHVAIIMDGNGRWAAQRDKPRMFGHARGAEAVKPIITEASNLNLQALTLYSFSLENWKRPENEVAFLMDLCCEQLRHETDLMMRNDIRFRHVGRREGLPRQVLDELDRSAEVTAGNGGTWLCLALNYGSRGEMVDAVRQLAGQVASGQCDPASIESADIDRHLYTAGLPDPDLLIRTAGEMRLSNFLLWQISYAELWVTQTLWPDFTVDLFHEALRDFAGRQRRFGALDAR
jgi:undecaprenyl diphosphate synthase